MFFCSLYLATYSCCWFIRNTNRQYFREFCWIFYCFSYYVSLLTIYCNFLSFMNKYSKIITDFSRTMNLKTKLIKYTGKLHLTVMIWIYVLRDFCTSLLAFLMTMHQSRNYEKRRNPSLINHGMIITYNILCASGMLAL